MTLHMLLVAIAMFTPMAGVVIEAPRLGVVGTLVGLCFSLALAAAQFRGHDWLLTTILNKLGAGWRASLLVGVYYISIPVVGLLCNVLALRAARFVGDFVRYSVR